LEQLTTTTAPGAPTLAIQWRSFELRPAGAPPIPPEYRARIEASRPQLMQVARERYNRTLDPGPFGIDSRPALIGAKFAEQQGAGPAYHDGVMRAYWQEARDISDRAVLAEIAAAAGMERAAFIAALDDPAFDAAVQQDVELARQYGLNGVPALVFDNRYLVSGAQPFDVLRRVVDQITAERSNPGTQ
jgi:predicted DsbA family dithiol-disulfide isomerase